MERAVKILLVEDLPSDAELAKNLLQNGFDPVTFKVAETQQEFISMLQNYKPDAIVSDFKLPSFDGLTALSITREKAPFTPFIILTGSMNEDTAVDCMKAGADDYVIKEHLKRLVPSVKQAIAKKKIEKEHHHVLSALEESEERYRAVVEHSHDGIIVIDDDYTVIYINNTTCTILGRPHEEILNHNFGDFLDIESRKLVADRYRQRRQGKPVPPEYEFSIIRKNGEKRRVTISAAIWKNSRGDIFSIAQLLDITDKKSTEDALRRERNLLARITDTSPVGIILTDRNGNIVFANRGAEKTLGRKKDEITSGSFNMPQLHITTINGNSFPDEDIPFNQVKRTGQPVYDVEHAIERPEGERIILSVNASPLLDGRGGFEGMIATIEDITEKKRTDTIIRNSEVKFRSYVENAPYGIFVADEHGRYLETNAAACSITGYTAAELLDMHIVDIIHPDYREKVRASFEKIADQGYSFCEAPFIKKDGSVRYWVVRGVQLTKNRFLGFASDITEQKKAGETLQESEERFRQVYEHMAVGVARVSLSFTIESANEAYCSMLGYTEEELKGKHLSDITHPEVVGKNLKMQTLLAEGKLDHFRMEKQFIHKTGQTVFGILDSNLVRDSKGAPLYFLGSVLDITDRKTAEEALRESEAQYRSLIEYSNDAIYLLYDGKFEIVNEKFEELLAVTKKQLMEPGFDMMSMVSASDRHIIQNRLSQVEHGNYTPSRYQFTAVRPGGTEIVLDASITYVPYKQGMAAQGILRDITKQIESKNRIKKNLEEKEVMLKEIHHRVKNNLNVITSLLNLQVGKIATKEQAVEAFNESRDRIFSMAMVHEILYQSDNLSAINMNSYIRSLTGKLINIYRSGTVVEIQFNNDDINIGINQAIPCGLILNELITNSLKHAFNELEKGRIAISFIVPDSSTYRLSVSDNGCGMPAPLDIQTTQSLGLQLIRILTEQLEGTLDIAVDHGTTFTMTFPAEH